MAMYSKGYFRFLLFQLCWLFFCFLCSSCGTETEDTLINKRIFEGSASITGEEILKADYSAIAIYTIDSLLLVQNNGTDNHYNIYSKASEKLLGKLGVRGDQKEAWKIIRYNKQFTLDDDGIKAWFTDFIKGKLYQVNLTKTIESGSPIPIVADTLIFDPNTFSTNNVYVASDSIIFGSPGYFEEIENRSIVKKMNLNTGIIEYSDLFPTIKDAQLLLSHEFYELYSGMLAVNESAQRIVTTSSDYLDRIEFFDWNLAHVKSVVGEGPWEDNTLDANILLKDREETVTYSLTKYYHFINSTEKYVYGLFYDQPSKEYGEILKPTEIHVFDWNGKVVYKFEVEDYLMNISVDQEDRFLYGVAFYDEKILKYDIHKYLAR